MEDREKIMQQWDQYRAMIADGDTSSLPRDWFESIIDRIFEPEDKWQPIETAPKDGTPILTLRGGYLQAVAEWQGPWPNIGASWCICDGAILKGVTHWQPLPSPPEGET